MNMDHVDHNELQLWLQKLTQFESELERLHIALSVPQKDVTKFNFLKKLAENDVPNTISKIQAKIAELQPPKPPTDTPPRARGRRPYRPFCGPNQPNPTNTISFDPNQNSEDNTERRNTSSYVKVDMQRDPGIGLDEKKLSKTLYGSPAITLEPGRRSPSSIRRISFNSFESITQNQPHDSANSDYEMEVTRLKEWRQGEEKMRRKVEGTKSANQESQNAPKILVTKIDLRGHSSCTDDETENTSRKEPAQFEIKKQEEMKTSKLFDQASSDGRIQLSYLAELTQHELYQ